MKISAATSRQSHSAIDDSHRELLRRRAKSAIEEDGADFAALTSDGLMLVIRTADQVTINIVDEADDIVIAEGADHLDELIQILQAMQSGHAYPGRSKR